MNEELTSASSRRGGNAAQFGWCIRRDGCGGLPRRIASGQPSGAKQAPGPVTIVWGIRTGATPEQVNKLLDDFKSQKPTISVEQFPAPGGIDPSLQKLSTALVAGTALDVISGHLTARMLNEAIDVLQPIDDLVKRDKFSTQQYNPEFLELAGKYEGKLQALPYAYGGDMVAVLYNRRMFQAAGIPEPIGRLESVVDLRPVARRRAQADQELGRPADAGRHDRLRLLAEHAAQALERGLAGAGHEDTDLRLGGDAGRVRQVHRYVLQGSLVRTEPGRGSGHG